MTYPFVNKKKSQTALPKNKVILKSLFKIGEDKPRYQAKKERRKEGRKTEPRPTKNTKKKIKKTKCKMKSCQKLLRLVKKIT
jgi:hypothetical protein